MRFLEADWLYLLIVPLLLMPVIALVGTGKRKKLLAALLGRNGDSPEAVHLSKTARFWRRLLLIAAIVLLIGAAARPAVSSRLLPFEPKGRDIMVLCDVSRSMNAADIAPSRLKHAQYILRQLTAREQGDRFGLVPFAGSAFLSCPLTSDPVTFNEYVDELSSDSVPVGGTNLEKALQVAEKAFAASESNSRAIVLLTDGEELQGDSSRLIAQLKKRHIPLFIIGFGDPVTGALIPKGDGEQGFVRDAAGKVVTSKLNETTLRRLAAETGGLYVRTAVTDTGVEKIEAAIARLDRAARENVKRQLPVEEFPKFLAAALGLLLLFLLIPEKKTPGVSLALLAAFLLSGASEVPPDAVKTPAKTRLVVPEHPAELYNLARQLQLAGNPEYAGLYEKLLGICAGDPKLSAMAYHNLGVGAHQECRNRIDAALQQLQKQQPDHALNTLAGAEKSAAGAEELYSRAAPGHALLPEYGANLTRLDNDRKKIEELKKKIEELKKQQQQARNQTRQAQKQNQTSPRDQQQRQQQKDSVEQARQAAEKLRKQAQDLKQSAMAESAQKAAEELKKAEKNKAEKEDARAREHIRKALEELKKHDGSDPGKPRRTPPEPGKGKEQDQQGEKKETPAPGRGKMDEKKQPGNAEELLKLMGEEDKKLRSALKQRSRMRRSQVEKDW